MNVLNEVLLLVDPVSPIPEVPTNVDVVAETQEEESTMETQEESIRETEEELIMASQPFRKKLQLRKKSERILKVKLRQFKDGPSQSSEDPLKLD